jgi:hypothetical protein
MIIIVVSSAAHAGVNVWTSDGPDEGIVFALAVDPATPSTLYAGTGDGGVFKSRDGNVDPQGPPRSKEVCHEMRRGR